MNRDRLPCRTAGTTGRCGVRYAFLRLARHRYHHLYAPGDRLSTKVFRSRRSEKPIRIIEFPVQPRTRQRLHQLDVTDRASARPAPPRSSPYTLSSSHSSAALHSSSPAPAEFRKKQRPWASPRSPSEKTRNDPITVRLRTNQLVGRSVAKLRSAVQILMNDRSAGASPKQPDKSRIPLWDGQAAKRLPQVIVQGSAR